MVEQLSQCAGDEHRTADEVQDPEPDLLGREEDQRDGSDHQTAEVDDQPAPVGVAGEIQRDTRYDDEAKTDRALPQDDKRVLVKSGIDFVDDENVVAQVVDHHADNRQRTDDVYHIVAVGEVFCFHIDYCSGCWGKCKADSVTVTLKCRGFLGKMIAFRISL